MQNMTSDFAAGNYRFIPAVFQYSAGVAASPGFEIERVRFDRPVALAEGFAQIAKYIQSAGRPLTSFCACELRSPAAFTDEGFRNFNLHYVKTLAEWGIYDGKTNPVARSNVCPEVDPPAEPSFYAFSFTRPNARTQPSFVIAGSGESQEGGATSHGRVRLWLEGRHCGADLHRARLSSGLCRRTGPPRRCAVGLDLAFCTASSDRSRIRDGLQAGDAGAGDLESGGVAHLGLHGSRRAALPRSSP
jgi:hypothetical protein